MAEFGDASLWMKLIMLLVSTAFSMHLFSMDTPGWRDYQYVCNNVNGNCNGSAVQAVQALEVIGFLCVLTALFLSLCLVLLDELKGNKIALIFLCIFALLAGATIICGIGVFEGMQSGAFGYAGYSGSPFASTIGVMAGICALLGGIFCILELCGVAAK